MFTFEPLSKRAVDELVEANIRIIKAREVFSGSKFFGLPGSKYVYERNREANQLVDAAEVEGHKWDVVSRQETYRDGDVEIAVLGTYRLRPRRRKGSTFVQQEALWIEKVRLLPSPEFER